MQEYFARTERTEEGGTLLTVYHILDDAPDISSGEVSVDIRMHIVDSKTTYFILGTMAEATPFLENITVENDAKLATYLRGIGCTVASTI